MAFGIRPVDPASFSTQRICPLRHDFHQHPLMQLPQLRQLAHNLVPVQGCRFITPGATQVSTFHHDPKDPRGLGIEEVFDRIEETGSWIALYNIERDPTYRKFLDEILDSVRPLVDPEQPGAYMVQGFIFISAPPSVTPFHIDRENNFWLQVRGRKTLNAWDYRDRETVAANEVDKFILYGGAPALDPKRIPASVEADVGPGEGMYWPSTTPHMTRTETSWVKPGDGVSISIGVVFYTPHMRRRANIHAANFVLRRFGIRCKDPGESAFDGLKYYLGRAVVWGKSTFRGYEPKPGIVN